MSLPTPTCRWSKRSSTPGSNGADGAISWIQAEDVEGLLAADKLATSTGSSSPAASAAQGRGQLAAAAGGTDCPVPRSVCLGMQVMTIEYARNAWAHRANSTEFDPTTLYPVIDLMDSPARRHPTGGTMRLGAYIAQLETGLPGGRPVRQRGGLRTPPPPLRVQPGVPTALRGDRLPGIGDVAGRSAGRVHRARGGTRSGSARRPILSS